MLSVVFGGAASALSSSEILLWERLKSHRGSEPTIVKVPVKSDVGSGDLSELLERLQREERERRLLDALLSQVADSLDEVKER